MKKSLTFNLTLAEGYKSPSQIIRRVTEPWVAAHIFTPCCHAPFEKYFDNTVCADFFCAQCGKEAFELKAQKTPIRKTVQGANYYTTIAYMEEEALRPNFLFMHYDIHTMSVVNLFAVSKQFFLPKIVTARKPLSHTARRAGWTGCTIGIFHIPEEARVYFVKEAKDVDSNTVNEKWEKSIFLGKQWQQKSE